ncbi:MAG: VTC domain-containing protein [Dehalococcoidales bacterium]|nr:VTC domain-containing protein [Dehalococcoidales bacterium]
MGTTRERSPTIELTHGTEAVETAPSVVESVERIERKFFIPPQKSALAYILLRQVCRADRQYPAGQINTLYFDSLDLDQHNRSASGDFRKDKVRIRWYDRLEDYQGEVPVFLEVKTRRGFASSKKRQGFAVPVQKLETANLGAGIIDRARLVETLARLGHYPEKPLRPVIVISYWRYRFTEMFTGVRVSFDSNIRSTMVARDLGTRERDLPLRGGVIEVKGPSFELPPALRHMKMLDIDWSRFSKYSHSIDAHLLHPGIPGRLWPPGRVVQR